MSLGFDHSFVSAANHDERNVRLGCPEPTSYGALGHRPAQSPNFSDFFCGQQLLVMGDSSDIDGMLSVTVAIDPLQIGDHTIPLHSVNMVDHREVSWIGYEGQSHQSVGVDRFAFPISIEVDVPVSELVDTGSQNLSVHSAGFHAVANAVKAPNSTKAADFIEVTKVIDRNRSPFFNADDIHVAGCLSGSDGLVIKDPSRATTFGGSAIMALDSDTYNRSIQCR